MNFVVGSIYARRYWSEGARAPALLAIVGDGRARPLATLRVFLPDLTPPV